MTTVENMKNIVICRLNIARMPLQMCRTDRINVFENANDILLLLGS